MSLLCIWGVLHVAYRPEQTTRGSEKVSFSTDMLTGRCGKVESKDGSSIGRNLCLPQLCLFEIIKSLEIMT